MNTPGQRDYGFETWISSRLIDVFIRAGLIGVLVVLCYVIFAPFLTLMAWALILAVTLYPLHRSLARRLGGKQALAATILVLGGVLLIIAPTALLMDSFGTSIHDFVTAVQENTLKVPAPRERIRQWPLVGEQIYDFWSRAHTDLPALVQSMQPKIGELARRALSLVATIGLGLLQFLASFIIAGILMAYGEAGTRGSRAIFERVMVATEATRSQDSAPPRSGPWPKEWSASRSFRRFSSAWACSSPAYRGRVSWRRSRWC
jgi:predicted PurR-regulated permease PerM